MERLILSASWGIIEGNYQSAKWTLAHDKLSSLKPDPNNENLVNYWQFLKIKYPKNTKKQIEEKKQKKALFFTKKGEGVKLKSEAEKVHKVTNIPKFLIE